MPSDLTVEEPKVPTIVPPQAEGDADQDSASENLSERADASEKTPVETGIVKKKRLVRKVNLVVCTKWCRYDIVKNEFKGRGWKCTKNDQNDWDLIWCDTWPNFDTIRLNKFQKINHFPGMTQISKKALLARNIARLGKKFANEFNFMPPTYVLPAELGLLKTQWRRKRTYILKPDTGCQGKGISLVRNYQKVHTFCQDMTEIHVCQQYLHRPYLVDGLKFDLRLYVLVTSCDPLRIFLYKEGMARFCTREYEPPDAKNINDDFMHLTNYAINKTSDEYVVDSEASDAGSKRSFSSILEHMASEGKDTATLMASIEDICVKTLFAAQPVLSQTYRSHFPQLDNNGFSCFEILGFDIMIDDKMKPWLLEVNSLPSFQTDTPFDELLKKDLIEETVALVNVNAKEKRKFLEEEKSMAEARRFTRHGLKHQGPAVNVEELHAAKTKYEDSVLKKYKRLFPTNTEKDAKYQEFDGAGYSLTSLTAATVLRRRAVEAQKKAFEEKKQISGMANKPAWGSGTKSTANAGEGGPSVPRPSRWSANAKPVIDSGRRSFRETTVQAEGDEEISISKRGKSSSVHHSPTTSSEFWNARTSLHGAREPSQVNAHPLVSRSLAGRHDTSKESSSHNHGQFVDDKEIEHLPPPPKTVFTAALRSAAPKVYSCLDVESSTDRRFPSSFGSSQRGFSKPLYYFPSDELENEATVLAAVVEHDDDSTTLRSRYGRRERRSLTGLKLDPNASGGGSARGYGANGGRGNDHDGESGSRSGLDAVYRTLTFQRQREIPDAIPAGVIGSKADKSALFLNNNVSSRRHGYSRVSDQPDSMFYDQHCYITPSRAVYHCGITPPSSPKNATLFTNAQDTIYPPQQPSHTTHQTTAAHAHSKQPQQNPQHHQSVPVTQLGAPYIPSLRPKRQPSVLEDRTRREGAKGTAGQGPKRGVSEGPGRRNHHNGVPNSSWEDKEKVNGKSGGGGGGSQDAVDNSNGDKKKEKEDEKVKKTILGDPSTERSNGSSATTMSTSPRLQQQLPPQPQSQLQQQQQQQQPSRSVITGGGPQVTPLMVESIRSGSSVELTGAMSQRTAGSVDRTTSAGVITSRSDRSHSGLDGLVNSIANNTSDGAKSGYQQPPEAIWKRPTSASSTKQLVGANNDDGEQIIEGKSSAGVPHSRPGERVATRVSSADRPQPGSLDTRKARGGGGGMETTRSMDTTSTSNSLGDALTKPTPRGHASASSRGKASRSTRSGVRLPSTTSLLDLAARYAPPPDPAADLVGREQVHPPSMIVTSTRMDRPGSAARIRAMEKEKQRAREKEYRSISRTSHHSNDSITTPVGAVTLGMQMDLLDPNTELGSLVGRSAPRIPADDFANGPSIYHRGRP